MSFISKIKELISKRNITVNKMCKDLEISKNSVNNWETRGNIPSGEIVQKLADYFEVSVDYLLGNDEVRVAMSSPLGYDELSDAQKEQINSLIELFRKDKK